MMQSFRNVATDIATLATLLSVAIGLVWYFVALEGRIASLEAQLQILAVAPALQKSRPVERDIDSQDSMKESIQETVANPILATCADLADRLAKAYEERASETSVSDPLKELMEKMGCLQK